MPQGRDGRKGAAQLTHFLCIPLVTTTSRPQLESAIQAFRNDISDELPRQAVRPPGTLHLTLGVMSLNATQLDTAIKVLQELDIKPMLALENAQSDFVTPLKVDLAGLMSMHEPEYTSVLYAHPQDETGRLLRFCSSIRAAFEEGDLLVAGDRPLKLHATVVNTIYAKGLMQRRGPATPSTPDIATKHTSRTRGSIKIDARAILEVYNDYIWAKDITIDRVAICEMGAKKKFDDEGRLIDEQYKEVAQITLPT